MTGKRTRPDSDPWMEETRKVRPLKSRPRRDPPAAPAAPARQAEAMAPPRGKAPPRAAPFDPGLYRKLASGRIALDYTVDLHGLSEDQAYRVLAQKLETAHTFGKRRILVITGKGKGGEGALKRALPFWLASPRFRPLVSSLTPADRRHGGDGAFYVFLRKA